MHPRRDGLTHVIFDTVAFVGEHPQLTQFGAGVNYLTTNGVLAEVRDKRSRFQLANFPYRIQQRVVSHEAMKEVEKFARKTGDYPSLSRTDMSLIALTLMIERETNGDKNINPRLPNCVKPVTGTERPSLVSQIESETKSQNSMKKAQHESMKSCRKSNASEKDTGSTPKSFSEIVKSSNLRTPSTLQANSSISQKPSPQEKPSVQLCSSKEDVSTSPKENVESSSTLTSSISSELPISSQTNHPVVKNKKRSGSGEWITPENYMHKLNGYDPDDLSQEETSTVAILTTDYAMQNVVLQLGLRLISLNGLSIRTLRRWLNKCYGCRAVSREMSRVYCANCGGATMTRVSVYVDKDGKPHYNMNMKHVKNTRGTRYSIPKRKGGTKNRDIILREDEWLRVNKRKQKKEKDLFLGTEEFASEKLSTENYSHRAKYGFGRKNPNEVKKSKGKRKKHR